MSMDNPNSLGANTTALLLQQLRTGNDQARAQLVLRLQPLLTRFAHGRLPRLLRHEQDTLDLVQSTWLKVLDKLDHIECTGAGMFFSYLRTVLLNGLREAMRKNSRAPFQHGEQDCEQDAQAQIAAENADPADWVAYEQLLQSLEVDYRALIIMRFEFGMSFVEIAQELDESADAVRMKLNRAIARMAVGP
jgi:RNA polymerase sigma factor (sigma-70 family)